MSILHAGRYDLCRQIRAALVDPRSRKPVRIAEFCETYIGGEKWEPSSRQAHAGNGRIWEANNGRRSWASRHCGFSRHCTRQCGLYGPIIAEVAFEKVGVVATDDFCGCHRLKKNGFSTSLSVMTKASTCAGSSTRKRTTLSGRCWCAASSAHSTTSARNIARCMSRNLRALQQPDEPGHLPRRRS
jgi:hypothetical protein